MLRKRPNHWWNWRGKASENSVHDSATRVSVAPIPEQPLCWGKATSSPFLWNKSFHFKLKSKFRSSLTNLDWTSHRSRFGFRCDFYFKPHKWGFLREHSKCSLFLFVWFLTLKPTNESFFTFLSHKYSKISLFFYLCEYNF